MATHTQPSISLEELTFRITDARDPSATVAVSDVEMALILTGEPGEADWQPATVSGSGTTVVTASILIGPGGAVEPTNGDWTAWIRWTSGTSTPVRSGTVTIT